MADSTPHTSVRRRTVLGAAGATALLSATSGTGLRPQRRAGEVVVLGGGMAGLAAAHELAERGFRVTVVRAEGLGRQGAQHPGSWHRHRARALTCRASTGSGSSPASTTTCRTR